MAFDKRFRTNSTADRLARLSVPKAKRYMKLREEGKGVEEALNIVAPLEKGATDTRCESPAKGSQLVLNTNQDKEEDPW
jgi:hypothetical protein